MRIAGVRVGGADDLGEQTQRGICEAILLENGVERHLFAMVSELAIRDVVDKSVANTRPIRVRWKKDELCFRIYELLDQPWTRDPVDFHSFPRDPLHGVPDPCRSTTTRFAWPPG